MQNEPILPQDTENQKCWIVVQRYYKDIHDHQSLFGLQYRHPITALSIIKDWERMYSEERDFKVFISKMILWKNIGIVDFIGMTRTELEDLAKKELTNHQNLGITK